MKTPNVAASVRQRLLNLAQSKNRDFNRVLTRYGVERLLCRLAASPHGERFLLKGATLFTVWEGAPHRATKDLDLLGFRPHSVDELLALFREVISTPVEPVVRRGDGPTRSGPFPEGVVAPRPVGIRSSGLSIDALT